MNKLWLALLILAAPSGEAGNTMKLETREVSYPSPAGGTVPATLVTPSGGENHCGALFLHPASGDRTTMLPMAAELSERGYLSLLIDAPFVRPGPPKPRGLANPAGERAMLEQTIADLHAGVDFLLKQPGVNPDCIAFVGRNFGAATGAVFVAREPRISAAVLQAGLPSMAQFWNVSPHPVAAAARAKVTPEQLRRFVALTEDLDAIRHIRHARHASLLFQFGEKDDWMTRAEVGGYFAAASSPKELGWYDTDHAFESQSAAADAVSWLRRLSSPRQVVAGFYATAFRKHQPAEAMARFVGPYYTQHNPHVADGKQPFIDYFTELYRKHPDAVTEVKRIVAEGNLVVVHAHSRLKPQDLGVAAIDIFRVENGKIVEHWDAVQAVPEKSANDNTMF